MKICISCEGVTTSSAQQCGHCGSTLLPTDAVHYPVRRGERDVGNPLLGSIVDGKYRLEAVLGRGGLGTVYRATHVGTLVTVALKLLHPRFAERPEYRRALLPEARRAATVTHAGCARLLDVGEAEEGATYLAMELVEGDTVDVLMRTGPLEPAHAVSVLRQIAEALEAIHAAGLVHCDLAPRNVMVSARKGQLQVKVLDFGIARTVTMAGPAKAPGGEFAGFVNPVFSAPELLARVDVDHRADVYSFGSLAWLILTGSPPIDDADPRKAAMAVAAGELRPWPRVPGVPRRLQRLVQQCVQHERDARPPTAAAIRHELAVVAGSRRPAFARAGVLVCAGGIMAMLAASGESSPPFLRVRTGSPLELAELQSPRATTVQNLSSHALETVGLHYGGFAAERLTVDVSRAGLVLLRSPLRPEADAASGTLTLSSAQPKWRELLEGLASASVDGPVDLSFVVPGLAPFGVARVQIDDTPPEVEASVEPGEGVLTGATHLTWRCRENVGVAAITAELAFARGRHVNLPLPGDEGVLDLGALLVDGTVTDLGGATLVVTARDRAGNVGRSPEIRFFGADVEAPRVAEVTGPAGEPFAAVVGDVVRMRVRLSQPEGGCTLRLRGEDQGELWHVPLPSTAWHSFEVPMALPRGRLAPGVMVFRVEDAAGNWTDSRFTIGFRDQTVRVEPLGTGPGAKWIGRELVRAEAATSATIGVDADHHLVHAEIDVAPTGGVGAARVAVAFGDGDGGNGAVHLELPALPVGAHVLRLVLEEREATASATRREIPLRVLPAAIEVQVPKARSRFLPGLLDSGVLVRRGDGYGDGPGWRIDPAMVPYLRGDLWLGTPDLASLPLPARTVPGDPLLPALLPVPGHNTIAVELRDVLDRRVHVRVGDADAPAIVRGDRRADVVADFWWNEGPALPVGEELLVEYGHPILARIRSPLPFAADERADVLLGIADSEIAARELTAAADGTIAAFEVPFAVWSVAAQLAGRRREDFADGMTRVLKVTLVTPAGRQAIELQIRTVRSTLEAVTLDRLAAVPPELAGLRLLPVLAPAAPFEEPVPADAPPRSLFRPQVATAVRDMGDLLLQERELTCGEARALMPFLERARRDDTRRFVHHDDPLGEARLRGDAMLPAEAAAAPADAPLTGVDFFQAWSLCRVLGLAVGDDPELFRLPFGCELELAAFGQARGPACSGVVATGGSLPMAAFRVAAREWEHGVAPTAQVSRDAGDVVPTRFGTPFVGLDFGVREWVADLPHVLRAELLLREWIGDHAAHLGHVLAFARGSEVPPPDLAGPLSTIGVVRGLALGELDGLVDRRGARLDPDADGAVPPSVPGVLWTEQLRRDGRDLLTSQRDPRLRHVGFRVAATAATIARLREGR